MPVGDTLTFEHTLLISASPARILEAFFDPAALGVWWQTTRSVTTPRPLGIYAIEWEPTRFRDELLGALGGVFYGTVVEFRAGREFFLGDAYWLPPEGDPIGPMGLHVSCTLEGSVVRLRVLQNGFDDSDRWRRYYAVITPGWKTSLRLLKLYLEEGAAAVQAVREAGRK